jgi:hypothetical protein
MADQFTTKPVGLIHDLKIYVHDIPYVTIFHVLQNNVVDISYSNAARETMVEGC